jgi:chromosome segregation ATPase
LPDYTESQCAQLESEFDGLAAEINAIDAEHWQEEEALKFAESEVEDVREEIQDHREEAERLLEERHDHEAELPQLVSDRDEIQAHLDETVPQRDELVVGIESAESELVAALDALEAAGEPLGELIAELTEVSGLLDEMGSDEDADPDRYEELATREQELIAEVEEAQATWDVAEAEVIGWQEHLEGLRGQLEEINDGIETIQGHIDEINAGIAEIEARMDAIDAEVADHDSRASELEEGRLQELVESLVEAQNDAAEWQGEREQLKERKNELLTELFAHCDSFNAFEW